MNAPFFHGDYPLTVDSKNRLQLPAAIRRGIDAKIHGVRLFVTRREHVLWLYPELYFRWLFNSLIQPRLSHTPKVQALIHSVLGSSKAVEWDPQGRVVLPDRDLRMLGLSGRQVMLVGSADHLEIWSVRQWNARSLSLDRRRQKVIDDGLQELESLALREAKIRKELEKQ